MENKSIFREKSIEKISSPEKLDDYLKVTTPSVWAVLIAIVLILAGALVWGIFGELEIHDPDGTTYTVSPISFIIN